MTIQVIDLQLQPDSDIDGTWIWHQQSRTWRAVLQSFTDQPGALKLFWGIAENESKKLQILIEWDEKAIGNPADEASRFTRSQQLLSPLSTLLVSPPHIKYVDDATLPRSLARTPCEALTFYFPADVAAATQLKFTSGLDLLLLDVEEASKPGGADSPACVAKACGFVRGTVHRGGSPVRACMAWIAWRDPGARDAFQAHAGGRANLALLMREDFKATRRGEGTGFWAPLELFANKGWEGDRVVFEQLERGGAGKLWRDLYVVQ